MKKFLKYLLVPAICFASCEKALDITPQDFVTTTNFFNNKAEIDVALNGVYEVLFSGEPYKSGYNEYWRYCLLGTDESTSNQGISSRAFPTHYNITSASSIVAGMWSTCFAGVNRANIFLENIDKSTTITDSERAIYKGEAKFLRAHYLFYLTQWFGDIPLRKSSTTSLADAQVAFTPSKEVYDYIISEMTEAQELLKDRPASAIPYNEKVSQTVVQGILSRVCLFAAGYPINDTKRYKDASYWAQQVIKSGLHKLDPDYADVFIRHSTGVYDVDNRETMWQVTPGIGLEGGSSLREQFVPRVGIFANSGIWGNVSGYERTNPRVYVSYAPGDIRREWNIAPFYLTGPPAHSVLNRVTYFKATDSKWSREPGKWRRYYEPNTESRGLFSSQAFPLLRYSDVLLMYAEAEAQVNGPTAVNPNVGLSAVDAVNLVRRRAYGETRGAKGVGFVNITNPGSGYLTAPECTFTDNQRLLRTEMILDRPYLNEDARATGVLENGGVKRVIVYDMGEGYINPPGVIVGAPFQATKSYTLNTQIVNKGNIYTVTKAGTSGTVAPTNTSGAFISGTATFTYAGVAATATVSFANADLTPDMYSSKDVFLTKTIRDERLRELSFECLRRQDLKRWGILVETVRSIANDVGSGSTAVDANGEQLYGPFEPPITSNPFNANPIIFTTGANSINEKDNLLPIPNSEIISNRLSKQNPGF